jgi:hypothetical protein
MGNEVSPRTRDAFLESLKEVKRHLDGSIEREKERNDFLVGVGMGALEYKEFLRQRWSSFLQQEARNLAEMDAISLAILGAVAYENTEKGYDCEAVLKQLLKQHYGELTPDKFRPEPPTEA